MKLIICSKCKGSGKYSARVTNNWTIKGHYYECGQCYGEGKVVAYISEQELEEDKSNPLLNDYCAIIGQ